MKKLTITQKVIFSLILLLIVLSVFKFANNTIPKTSLTGKVIINGTDIDDPFLGPKDAKIVVIEFSDFECPYCGAVAGTNEYLINRLQSTNPDWEAPIPKLKELAENGEIKFVFKHVPLSFHKDAQLAAEASEAAHAQGKFWEYHDLLYQNADKLAKSDLIKYAKQLDLDVEQFKNDLNTRKYKNSVEKDMTIANAYGIQATPSFIINGKLIKGAVSFQVFEEEINKLK